MSVIEYVRSCLYIYTVLSKRSIDDFECKIEVVLCRQTCYVTTDSPSIIYNLFV